MNECPERPTITPEMTVAALLDAYPDVEPTLLELAPALNKLTSPALRKTVAGVTDIRKAAEASGVSLGEMIGKLRTAAGVEEEWTENDSQSADRPEWVGGGAIVKELDARQMIEAGEHPLPQVMTGIQQLGSGEVFLLITPFTPTPMIEKVHAMGNLAWTEQISATEFRTYFGRGG